MSAASAEAPGGAVFDTEAAARTPRRLWMCFAGLLMAQFVAVLDVQIVSSSLAVIQADVSASADEISWVQTCYLIAETLGIPLVGYLTRLVGLRALLAFACGSFAAISLAVGLCEDLTSLIVARTLQGFVGGLMLPLAFTFGFTAFAPGLKNRISLLLGLVAVLAPTIGPTLGGYVSEELGWQWLFYINMVPCAVAVALVWNNSAAGQGRIRPSPRFDWPSLFSLSICLMSVQFVLEEGDRRDWLESDLIAGLSLAAIVTFALFLRRSLTCSAPLLDLRPFQHHDFRAGFVMIVVGGLSLFGGSYLLPLFLADVRHYSPMQIGETLLVSGAVMLASGLLLGPRIGKLDLRVSIAGGFAAAAYGFWLGHEATAQWDYWELAALQTWRGLGVFMAITATQTLTMRSVDPHQASSATSLLFLARNLGGAVGVALLSSTLAATTGQAESDLAAAARPEMLRSDSLEATVAQAAELQQTALVLGFGQCFAYVAVACAGAALLALTLGHGGRKPRTGRLSPQG